MTARPPTLRWLGAALLGGAMAVPPGAPAAAAGKSGTLLPGSTGKEPISIDAAKLDYFDKEQKLVYAGDVVARQGDSSLKASAVTIFLAKDARKAGAGAEAPSPAAGSSIERMEAAGPVTVTDKDEVGTGDNATYDKAANRVTITGHVTLTQAANVVKGDRLVYDMTTGQVQVSGGATQDRVSSVITPVSGTPGAGKEAKPAVSPKARRPARP